MFKRLRWLLLAAAVLVLGAAGVYAWAEYSLRAARGELDEFRPAAARRQLEHCPRFFSGRAEFHLLAGRAARMLEDYPAAEEHLVECQRLEGTPSEESTLEWAMLQAQRGDVDAVEEFLRRSVDKNHPQSPLILEAMTAGYLRVFRIFDALNCLRMWLERQPGQPRALLLRGKSYQQVHAFGRAVDDFKAVVNAEPDNDEAKLLLANALVENSQAADAVPYLEDLRTRRPDDPDVLVRLAFAWNIAGRVAESSALLDNLLAKHPRLGPALSARGQLELQLRHPAAAERWLREALKETPYDRQTHYALFQALQQQGKERDADEQEARLKKIEATISRMIEVTNRLLPMQPRDPKLNYELGTLLNEMGYEDKAALWFLKAVQYDPQFAAAHKALAEFYQKRGNAERAAYHRRLAVADGREK